MSNLRLLLSGGRTLQALMMRLSSFVAAPEGFLLVVFAVTLAQGLGGLRERLTAPVWVEYRLEAAPEKRLVGREITTLFCVLFTFRRAPPAPPDFASLVETERPGLSQFRARGP